MSYVDGGMRNETAGVRLDVFCYICTGMVNDIARKKCTNCAGTRRIPIPWKDLGISVY